jgi:tubulin beta
MPREIVHTQVGQCGNQIGLRFWEYVCGEHGVQQDGKFFTESGKGREGMTDSERGKLDKLGVYFRETGELRFTARAILVDLEPGILDKIRSSPYGGIFRKDAVNHSAGGAGNNWAKGHYTEGNLIIESIEENIRKEAEACDCVQGFQITHSLGGGTGSGLGTLVLVKVRDAYADRLTATYSVYPSPKVSDVVVEPYNAILSIHQLLENSDETFVIDNEALYNISHNVLKLEKDPTFLELNHVISLVMGGITSSLRFPGKLNGDLRKMGVNLVPFPRLHFFLLAQAPLFAPADAGKVKLSVQELTEQMWSGKNFLANVKAEDGKYLTASCLYRGPLSTEEVDRQVAAVQEKYSDDFVEWIPNNIKTSMISTPPADAPMSATFVANTTAIKSVCQRISAQFATMYKRKAFLHWYTGEGMDQMEFQEADSNVRDLVSEYIDKQDAEVDLDSEKGSEEASGTESEEGSEDAEEEEEEDNDEEEEDE